MTSSLPLYIEETKSPNGGTIRTVRKDLVRLHLFDAVYNNDVRVIHEMAEHGIKFDQPEGHGFNPLLEAIKRRHENVLNALMFRGADPRILEKNKDLDNPYVFAASVGKIGCLTAMHRQKPPPKDVKLAMIQTAAANNYMTVLAFMNENDMFAEFDFQEPALKKLLDHPTMYIAEPVREFIKLLYNKAPLPQTMEKARAEEEKLQKAFQGHKNRLDKAVRRAAASAKALKRRK